MCLPCVGDWGLLSLVQFLGRDSQFHWHRKCSKCGENLGAYAVVSIVTIVHRFRLGQALLDFGEIRLDIVVGMLGMG